MLLVEDSPQSTTTEI